MRLTETKRYRLISRDSRVVVLLLSIWMISYVPGFLDQADHQHHQQVVYRAYSANGTMLMHQGSRERQPVHRMHAVTHVGTKQLASAYVALNGDTGKTNCAPGFRSTKRFPALLLRSLRI